MKITDLLETPIDATDDPNDPMIYGHAKANPMTLKGRIMQARAQLKDLAERAESNDLLVWQSICRDAKGGLFMGLEQNLEQIRHGISELAAKRKKGGVGSRGIDTNIGERFKFAGDSVGQKPGDQVRGTDKTKSTGPILGAPEKKISANGRLVGGSS